MPTTNKGMTTSTRGYNKCLFAKWAYAKERDVEAEETLPQRNRMTSQRPPRTRSEHPVQRQLLMDVWKDVMVDVVRTANDFVAHDYPDYFWDDLYVYLLMAKDAVEAETAWIAQHDDYTWEVLKAMEEEGPHSHRLGLW
jgi:hypothetical protein